MRRRIMLGLGLAGVMVVQSSVSAQSAPAGSTAPPTQPTPAAPAASQPAGVDHPWYVRTDLGPWMICVKSYTGPDSRQLAEALAAEIRKTHNAGAYLFEWGAEERKQEMARREKVKAELRKEQAPFLAIQEEMKAKAASEGIEFIETKNMLRVPIVRYPEQWAVLLGGFKDMDTARKALDVIRKWPPPKDTRLMDQAFIARASQPEAAYINPFASAMTAPNPAVSRANPDQPQAIDPAVVKLNEAEELSLLKSRKPWTLMVKRFIVPTHVQGDAEDGTVFDKIFGQDEGARWLEITATNARTLAQALRSEKMAESLLNEKQWPHPLESFVLHYRTESLVTVGQFSGPDDPELAKMWQLLSGMTFQVGYNDGRPPERKKMFDAIIPMQVPQVR